MDHPHGVVQVSYAAMHDRPLFGMLGDRQILQNLRLAIAAVVLAPSLGGILVIGYLMATAR